jgi:hypothetical protein
MNKGRSIKSIKDRSLYLKINENTIYKLAKKKNYRVLKLVGCGDLRKKLCPFTAALTEKGACIMKENVIKYR